MNHIMVDLETLGTSPNSVILTIGAIRFNPIGEISDNLEDSDTFYRRVEIESFANLDLNHQIDDATVEWWSKQEASVQEEAFAEADRFPIDEVLQDFHRWVRTPDAIWGNGYGFDMTILQHFYRELKRGWGWNYWQERDSRTLFALCPDYERPKISKHHALWDCWAQIVAVQECYRRLNLVEDKRKVA